MVFHDTSPKPSFFSHVSIVAFSSRASFCSHIPTMLNNTFHGLRHLSVPSPFSLAIELKPMSKCQPLFQRALVLFVSQFGKQGECLTLNSGSPTKRLFGVTDMDSGRRIHVPAAQRLYKLSNLIRLLSWSFMLYSSQTGFPPQISAAELPPVAREFAS